MLTHFLMWLLFNELHSLLTSTLGDVLCIDSIHFPEAGMVLDALGAEDSEWTQSTYLRRNLGATQLRMTWCIHMSDMDDMAAQQVLVSIGTCQWPVTSFWLLLEQPLRNHALLPASVETAWQKVVLIRLVWLDLYLGSASTSSSSSLSVPISTFIICHPSQSLYTPTKHKTKNRCWRNPTPTPAESAPNKNRPPSLASKKRCNENNGQQECTKPGLGVFHEAQQVRL